MKKRRKCGLLKKWLCLIMAAALFFQMVTGAGAEETASEETQAQEGTEETGISQQEAVTLQAPSALLMEASTGTVLYEKDAHTRRAPASVTKIMTTLLIFEELEKGNIKLEDEVVTSAHAKSMGGSQVFLEEGEKQTVDTLLKCILVSSGNDASVAMAEYVAGSELEFVSRMNKKAEELGMENTHFEDCCGLTDSDNHYTTAYDIALMSRELITRFPQVHDYTTIWMENITHVTRQGSSEFGLSNTNKLLRSYDGCNGLKTGSTSKALFCISATAKRNNIQLISVIMAGSDSKTRNADAAALLNYGFGKCRIYIDSEPVPLPEIRIKKGLAETASCYYETEFRYLDMEGQNLEKIERKLELDVQAKAPVKKGQRAGRIVYLLDGKEIGSVDILFGQDVEKAGYIFYLKKAWEVFAV
ncbi:MAG: D-alanyl-D-alanine carboxypeptidase family protein [Eubacteriales bacterium]|nr:D-alanyl-D-alanine carboxypeptidase family protein [Eubacteriales bacterium]